MMIMVIMVKMLVVINYGDDYGMDNDDDDIHDSDDDTNIKYQYQYQYQTNMSSACLTSIIIKYTKPVLMIYFDSYRYVTAIP